MSNDAVAKAIIETFMTPNEMDSNFEAAGPTDGLFAIARAIGRLADAINGMRT